VTFIAEKQGDKWIAINVALSMVETAVQSRGRVNLAADLHIHTIDPTSIIEAIHATPFQKSVWRAIVGIIPGNTVSYTNLAVIVGQPSISGGRERLRGKPVRMRHSLPPRHGTNGNNGKLGGYRWGPKVKAALLVADRSLRDDLEKA